MRWIAFLIIFLASNLFAHGGGLNTCGGHNNRKTGTYHVHRMYMHCACYPDKQECKTTTDEKITQYIEYLEKRGYEVIKK